MSNQSFKYSSTVSVPESVGSLNGLHRYTFENHNIRGLQERDSVFKADCNQ